MSKRPPKQVWIVYSKDTGEPLLVEVKKSDAKARHLTSKCDVAGPYVLAERVARK